MRVKIGDTWYDSTQTFICIQVSEKEQSEIANIDRSVCTEGKYAVFHPTIYPWTKEEYLDWMKG